MDKELNIKAVEMVRRIRDQHYELLKNASHKERMAFYNEGSRALHEELEKERAKEHQEEKP